jgi:transcriptional regulator with XRE-family HTH domain
MTEQEFLKSVGQKIRKFRNEADKTLEEISAIAGVHKTDLSSFERHGEKIKGMDIVRRIVEATGHTMQDLFTESEKKTSNFPCPTASARPSRRVTIASIN